VVDPELTRSVADGPAAVEGELGGVAAELLGVPASTPQLASSNCTDARTR